MLIQETGPWGRFLELTGVSLQDSGKFSTGFIVCILFIATDEICLNFIKGNSLLSCNLL